jgi:radical SAM protein with 4Fe4S-binding SPASM domain
MTVNVDDVDRMVDLAEKLDVDLQFGTVLHPRLDGDHDPLRFAVSAEDMAQKVYSRFDLFPPPSADDAAWICTGEGGMKKEGQLCAAARGVLSIGADGGVYACPVFPTPAGHLRDAPLKSIWDRAAQFNAIRQTRFGDLNQCPTCENQKTCNPCLANALVESGDMKGCNSSSRTLSRAQILVAQSVHESPPAPPAKSARANRVHLSTEI